MDGVGGLVVGGVGNGVGGGVGSGVGGGVGGIVITCGVVEGVVVTGHPLFSVAQQNTCLSEVHESGQVAKSLSQS